MFFASEATSRLLIHIAKVRWFGEVSKGLFLFARVRNPKDGWGNPLIPIVVPLLLWPSVASESNWSYFGIVENSYLTGVGNPLIPYVTPKITPTFADSQIYSKKFWFTENVENAPIYGVCQYGTESLWNYKSGYERFKKIPLSPPNSTNGNLTGSHFSYLITSTLLV